MTYLLKTLLADGLRVDLYLEDNGVGLTDEAPHLRDRSSLGDVRICVELIPRRTKARRLSSSQEPICTLIATDVYNENEDNNEDDVNDNNNGLSLSGYAAGRRPVVPGGTFFVITKLQKLRTCTAVTATGSRVMTTYDVDNVLVLVSETERGSSASISRHGMAHALTARRRRGSVREIESLSGRSIEWR